MTIGANEYQKAKSKVVKDQKEPESKGLISIEDADGLKPKEGHKFQKRLGKKKTIRDNTGGGDWEVTEKREQFLVERPIESDSEAGSELSYD